MRTLVLIIVLSSSVQAQQFTGNQHHFPPSQLGPQFGVYNPYQRNYTLYYQFSGPTFVPQHHYSVYGQYPTTIMPRLYVPITVPQRRYGRQ